MCALGLNCGRHINITICIYIKFVVCLCLHDKNINCILCLWQGLPPRIRLCRHSLWANGAMLCTARGPVDDPLLNLSSFWYLIILWQALSSKLCACCRYSRPTQLMLVIKDVLINSDLVFECASLFKQTRSTFFLCVAKRNLNPEHSSPHRNQTLIAVM